MLWLSSINSKQERSEILEVLAFKYPTWFFEVLCEFEGGPVQLEDFQVKYLLDESTFKITNKCRQAGGSLQVSMAKFFRAYTIEGYRCDIVSINLREATDKIKYIKNLHDTIPQRYRKPLTISNALSIGFGRGAKLSMINSLAASNPRGGKKEMVFDEFAFIPRSTELFHAAAPAIMNGTLTLDVISTPAGKHNMFYKIWANEPEPGPDGRMYKPYSIFSRHEFIWPDVRRFVTNYDEVQHVWYNVMQRDMSRMPELVNTYGTDKLKFFLSIYPWSQFKQEFCGEFIDDSQAVFPMALLASIAKPKPAGNIDVGELSDEIEDEGNTILPWVSRPLGNDNPVYIGVDFGESDEETDKTSIQVLERDRRGKLVHRYQETLVKREVGDFPAQAEHIADVIQRFKPQKVLMDETGLGRTMVPLIKRLAPNTQCEGINFNLTSKEEMVMNTKSLMEHDELWIQQDDRALIGQLNNIKRTLTAEGRARYSGKPDLDDMAWALMLAARGGQYKPFRVYSIGSRWLA